MQYEYIQAIGQDSHRFADRQTSAIPEKSGNGELVLGAVNIPGERPLVANSDGDVLLHALTNAVSGATGVNILGEIADRLCLEKGITDSREYLKAALSYLGDSQIVHVSFSVECKTPKLSDYMDMIRQSVGGLLSIDSSAVGITATSGEGLSSFGRGEGIMAFCSITVRRRLDC